MGQRATALADRLVSVNNDLIAKVEGCSDEQWAKTCGEGWSVGVTAHHVASSHGPVAGLVQAVANSQPVPPITMDMIDAGNAQHARDHANCTREETAAMLRKDGNAAAEMLRGLSDEQLDRSTPIPFAGGASMSANDLTEMILIGHPTEHLKSITEAAG